VIYLRRDAGIATVFQPKPSELPRRFELGPTPKRALQERERPREWRDCDTRGVVYGMGSELRRLRAIRALLHTAKHWPRAASDRTRR
jgi:hypothetical protein